MAQINETTQGVLDQISEGFAQKGAYNLRQNGVSICHGDSEHIKIRKKEDKPAPPAKPTEKECPYCKTKIAITATRCPHCTSILSDEIQSEAAAALKE